jgi:hypothetical protein
MSARRESETRNLLVELLELAIATLYSPLDFLFVFLLAIAQTHIVDLKHESA